MQETPFFRSWGGSWDSEYGVFFLGWYSGALLQHGETLMAAAAAVFHNSRQPSVFTARGAGGGSGPIGNGAQQLSTLSIGGATSAGTRLHLHTTLARVRSTYVTWRVVSRISTACAGSWARVQCGLHRSGT